MVALAYDTSSFSGFDLAPPADRRGSVRSSLFILVRIKARGELMWATDISLGGMQCRARLPHWPGTYLDVSFALPDTRESIDVGAQVISLGQAGDGEVLLGLRFCRLTARAEMAIYRFLDRRRALWSQPEPSPMPERAAAKQRGRRHPALAALLAQERPFAMLLYDAHRSLRDTGRQASAPTGSASAWLRRLTTRQLIVAGGIRSQQEVDALDALGADAVVGMAVYTELLAV